MTMQSSPVELAALRALNPKKAVSLIVGVSVAALAVLLVVIYGHGRASAAPAWTEALPVVNAILNGVSAAFLVLAYRAVRARNFAEHGRHMLRALASSALFLVSYIAYHAVHGDTKFGGHGPVRAVYFFVLVTHIVLSAVVLPMVFTSFFFALSGRLAPHKKISRFTLPVWLYVSVTGVLVFAMLRLFG